MRRLSTDRLSYLIGPQNNASGHRRLCLYTEKGANGTTEIKEQSRRSWQAARAKKENSVAKVKLPEVRSTFAGRCLVGSVGTSGLLWFQSEQSLFASSVMLVWAEGPPEVRFSASFRTTKESTLYPVCEAPNFLGQQHAISFAITGIYSCALMNSASLYHAFSIPSSSVQSV